MPSPKDKAKLTGDTHLPDIDESLDTDESSAQAADDGGRESGGQIKDKEAKTSNSYGHTRDSGERPEVSPKK